MSVNVKQFEENKIWINQQLQEVFPKCVVTWDVFNPTIVFSDGHDYDIEIVAKYVSDLIEFCGGKATFDLNKLEKK